MSTTLRGIEQGRADYAFRCATTGSNLKKEKKVDNAYKSYAKKIPMLIKTNGLGATFAFIFSKMSDKETSKDHAYKQLYLQTDKWLREEKKELFEFIPQIDQNDRKIEFADALILLTSTEYRAVTNEVLALFTWIRRFAEGLIDGDDDGNP